MTATQPASPPPPRVRKSVDEVVADIVANQAAEGLVITADEITRLTAEITEKRADELTKHGGL
jgi:predicted house-cleaning NTP pyrophosphatase (Maf/HAM1 superfamily)